MPIRKTIPIKTTGAVKSFTSWSFSRYRDYTQCALAAKLKHLDKIVNTTENKKEPIVYGNAAHAAAEAYVKAAKLPEKAAAIAYATSLSNQLAGDKQHALWSAALKAVKASTGAKPKLPEPLARFPEELAQLRKVRADPELNLGFTQNWEPCAPTDWNRCWLRVKIDARYVAEDGAVALVDYKTGKFREAKAEEYLLQLDIYATAEFAAQPRTQVVIPQLWYLDEGMIYPEDEELRFTYRDAAKLRKAWEQRVRPMFNDKKFAPRPGSYCRWCHYRKDNDGPCPY